MATNTPNLQLRKPNPAIGGDNVNVTLDFNNNWDTLDTKVQQALDGNSSQRPYAQLRNTTATVVTSGGTGVKIQFQTEDKDSHNGHDPVTNNTRYTCQSGHGGWYRVNGSVGWVARASTGSSDVRACSIFKNGAEVPGTADQIRALDQAITQPVSRTHDVLIELAPGDFVELNAFQNSGTDLNTFVGGGLQSILTVEWMRPS